KDLNLFYFGYTNCPDVCPLTLTYLTQAVKNLSAKDQDKIQVFFISVDYDKDTAASTANYAKAFHPLFHGFTGSKEQIDALIKQFHGSYVIEKNEKSYLGYSITHTDRVFFVNDKGKILNSIANVKSVESLANEIHEHL
ncbi:MAG: SCO family protein, partial [Pseudobdellovibrionaceae bacterium]